MSHGTHHIIINPNAGGGATGRDLGALTLELRAAFSNGTAFTVARSAVEAELAARRALLDGASVVVAVGGDGTYQAVVRGFFNGTTARRPDAALALVSLGTGRGFAHSLGIAGDLRGQIATIHEGRHRAVDLIAITPIAEDMCEELRAAPTGTDGQNASHARTAAPRPAVELCINECQFGIGGTVVRRVRGALKRLGGRAAFGLGTLATSLTQQPSAFSLCCDGAAAEVLPLLGIVIANGARTGGGMQLVPGADASDGMLDVLCIHAMSVPARIRGLGRIYQGAHVDGIHFSQRRCRVLDVRVAARVEAEADGERLAPGSRRFEVLPAAIHILVPDGGAS